MPAINSRCRQPHKPGFLFLDSFRPVFRQALKSCTFLFFILSELLNPHNHPSLIPLISENQPFPAYSLLSFRDRSFIDAQRLYYFILSCSIPSKKHFILLFLHKMHFLLSIQQSVPAASLFYLLVHTLKHDESHFLLCCPSPNRLHGHSA